MKIAPIFAAFSLMLVCLTSAGAQQCPDGYILPSPTMKLQAQAEKLRQDGKPAAAAKIYQSLAFSDACGKAMHEYSYGMCLIQEGKPIDAMKHFEQLQAAFPEERWYKVGAETTAHAIRAKLLRKAQREFNAGRRQSAYRFCQAAFDYYRKEVGIPAIRGGKPAPDARELVEGAHLELTQTERTFTKKYWMISQAADQLRIMQVGAQSLTAESFARLEPLMHMPDGFEKKKYSYPEHWQYLIAPAPKNDSR